MENQEVEKLLNSVLDRFPYAVFNKFSSENNLSKIFRDEKIEGSKRSYPEKIKALKQLSNIPKHSGLFDLLKTLYIDNTLFGSKYIQYFKFNELLFKNLLEFFNRLKAEDNILSQSYPYVLNKKELKNTESNHVVFVGSSDSVNQKMFSFTRVVDFEEKTTINSDLIRNAELTQEYYEFIGIKKYKKQFFDQVIFHPKSFIVEIRIDYFKNSSDNQCVKHFNDLLKELIFAYDPKYLGFFSRFKLNIHSAIKMINSDMTGRLVEICFSTKEGSNIKIKKRKANLDIRDEAYHKAGSKAVLNNLDIYRIGSIYSNEKSENLEILIPGSSKLIHASSKEINEVIISNCVTSGDFNFIKSKISRFLK